MTLLLIAVAGAAGCVVRFVSEYGVRRHHPTLRPWATVAANAVGSGIAGWAAYRLIGNSDLHLHEIVITGFCGGLTTFSSAPPSSSASTTWVTRWPWWSLPHCSAPEPSPSAWDSPIKRSKRSDPSVRRTMRSCRAASAFTCRPATFSSSCYPSLSPDLILIRPVWLQPLRSRTGSNDLRRVIS